MTAPDNMIRNGLENQTWVHCTICFHKGDVQMGKRRERMEQTTIAESDRVALEPNFSKLVGHPASDKEIRINRGNHRCENALHLMFTSTTALDSTAGSSRHTRLSCMLTFLENTGSHNRLLSMVQNIPVRIRCNESMCRRT